MADYDPEIHEVLHRQRDALLGRANVVAAGIGYKVTESRRTDRISIACSVVEKKPLAQLAVGDRVPEELDGFPTDVIETGVIRALQSRTGRHRPAPGGVSIGHPAVTAGTLGCLVRKGGDRLILSNNHVLANSNDASIGDAIYQPGPYDGGGGDDVIATLADFVPIRFPGESSDCSIGQGVASAANLVARVLGSGTRLEAVRIQQEDNLVDAAVARPVSDDAVVDEILDVGPIAGVVEGTLGTDVQKSGRTTGHTRGQITQVDVSVNVSYGTNRIALFTDQLMAGPMSQGGDSGSAVLDAEGNLVGLLFAGSDSTTIFNRIQNVFTLLDVGR
jgi:hypothetical protein